MTSDADATVDTDEAPIRVVLVDDQDLVRTSMRMMIDVEPDLTVIGEASSGAEAVHLVRRLRPDVVVMDVRMPHLDGIEATRRITAQSDERPAVLALTTFDLDEYLFEMLQAGAAGFVLKDDTAAVLLAGVRAVARGDGFVSPGPTRRLIASQRTRPPRRPLPELTGREAEVMALIGQALTNAQIGRRLDIEESTVKTHVKNLCAKLDVNNRVQIAVLAHQLGVVADNP